MTPNAVLNKNIPENKNRMSASPAVRTHSSVVVEGNATTDGKSRNQQTNKKKQCKNVGRPFIKKEKKKNTTTLYRDITLYMLPKPFFPVSPILSLKYLSRKLSFDASKEGIATRLAVGWFVC
jgi:hypothetical protein